MTTQFVSRGRELEVDLESGGTTNQEDKVSDPISANGQTKTILKRACTGPMGFHRLANSSNFSELAAEDVELLIDNNSEGEEGQQNITFVDRKDVKLMKEITELAMRKRARIERLKAIKKMRAAKTSSWSSSLSAMVITIVFCLIILYQGISSRYSGSLALKGSPESAVGSSEALIGVQFYKNNVAYESDESGSRSSDLAGRQVSGSGSRMK
ncbi:PROTEIN putative-RELATED [Salix purpurea]|uniref:PROTEIN putative-RELATED n=1 Tax=Salix purpurea TaxID=77065 RepID=A0A9Q0P1X7_SALPP|nr:PROTEIN putative-RELATED [Salix purpurea]